MAASSSGDAAGIPEAEEKLTLCVRNEDTGKRYKVAVRRHAENSDLSDVTALTLKKNFAPLLRVPCSSIRVAWLRDGDDVAACADIDDAASLPLGGLVLLIPAAVGAVPADAPLLVPRSQQQAVEGLPPRAPSVSAMASPTPATHADRRSGSSEHIPQLSTPAKQELLDIAKQIFHAKSPLRFYDANREPTALQALPTSSHIAEKGGSPGDDVSYGNVVSLLTAPRRERSSTASLMETLDDDSRDPVEAARWRQRCAALEARNAALESELAKVIHGERSVSLTSSAPHAESGGVTPPQHPRHYDPLQSRRSTSVGRDVWGVPSPSRSLSRTSAQPILASCEPMPALAQELKTLKQRRRMLDDIREGKQQDFMRQRSQLLTAIDERKNALMQRYRDAQRSLQESVKERVRRLETLRATVDRVQGRLRDSDMLADTEKLKVDHVTHSLDSVRTALARILDCCRVHRHDPSAVKEDNELAQFLVSTSAQKHKHLVVLTSRRQHTASLRHTYDQTLEERRRLHHLVEDAKGNIRVVIRMRPRVPADELQPQHVRHLEDGSLEVDTKHNCVFLATPTTGVQRYEFYGVYGPPASPDADSRSSLVQQRALFEEQVQPLLTSVLDGVNVAVMAYGPTGSGKTFTILGSAHDGAMGLTGLFPQSVRFLLSALSPSASGSSPSDRSEKRLLACNMTMVEVYLDQAYDILGQIVGGSVAAKVEVRQGVDSVTTHGTTEVSVSDWEDAAGLIVQALRTRKTHKTLKNFESSRSHLIMTLHISVSQRGGGQQRSKLVFVDLAGSERVSRSLSQGDRLKEAQHINKSLSALGDVVHALSSVPRPSYIPYRNSRLTQLLYDTIGGNSKALFVTCICPHIPQLHNLVESQSTLKFASRVKTVRNALLPPAASDALCDGDPVPLRRTPGVEFRR